MKRLKIGALIFVAILAATLLHEGLHARQRKQKLNFFGHTIYRRAMMNKPSSEVEACDYTIAMLKKWQDGLKLQGRDVFADVVQNEIDAENRYRRQQVLMGGKTIGGGSPRYMPQW